MKPSTIVGYVLLAAYAGYCVGKKIGSYETMFEAMRDVREAIREHKEGK